MYDRQLLQKFILEKSLKFGDFVLASGKKASYISIAGKSRWTPQRCGKSAKESSNCCGKTAKCRRQSAVCPSVLTPLPLP
ncbi:MAG: hypothetical protein FWE67_04525 [Planctomycetaceae bacterium]|nr:hypothetical protein [Planctomycetaceae bacterium]